MATTLVITGVQFPNGTIQTTAAAAGGVTSLAAGDGIAVSGATGAVTVSAVVPAFNAIGSYTIGGVVASPGFVTNINQTAAGSSIYIDAGSPIIGSMFNHAPGTTHGKTGTWRAMLRSQNGLASKSGTYTVPTTLWVRIA